MKRKTANTITNILGYLMWLAVIPVVFLSSDDANTKVLMIKAAALLIGGIIAIYFKNNDAQALLHNYLKRFKV